MKKNDPFIITYMGKRFFFDSFTPEDICIEDIAHALSHLCRFTGHLNMFYSVAQHSLLVSEKVPGNPGVKLAALLHDAVEAYTGDMASPLKGYLWKQASYEYGDGVPSYIALQDRVGTAIYQRFGITGIIPASVQQYDQAACLFEAQGFMGLSLDELKEYGQGGFDFSLDGLWQPWSPETFAGENSDREPGEVETEFIHRFEALMHLVGRESLV